MDVPLLPVLHRDDDVLVLSKPSGLSIHRGWANEGPTVVSLLRNQLGIDTVHPVHRLDRGTSGALLVALNPNAAARLASLFRNQEVEKTYLALVRGHFQKALWVDHPVPKEPGAERVAAKTRFEPIEQVQTLPRETSIVRAQPITGRTHQIRRHLKHLSHPIIGDANYGKGALNRALRESYGLARLALHALSIAVEHPTTGKRLEVRAPLADDLRNPLIAMGYEKVLNLG